MDKDTRRSLIRDLKATGVAEDLIYKLKQLSNDFGILRKHNRELIKRNAVLVSISTGQEVRKMSDGTDYC